MNSPRLFKSPKKQIFLAPDLFKFACSSLYCTLYLWRPLSPPSPPFSSSPTLPPCVSFFWKAGHEGKRLLRCQSKQHKVPKVTANKPDEKAKCFGWTAVSWVTLSDQTGETGTCLLRLRVGDLQRQMQMLPLRADAGSEGSAAQAELIGNTPEVQGGDQARPAPAQQPGVLPLGTATIPPSGGTLQEGDAERWWLQ